MLSDLPLSSLEVCDEGGEGVVVSVKAMPVKS